MQWYGRDDLRLPRLTLFALKGVDFPNVKIVCNIGLPSTLVDVLQRAGRAVRVGDEDALFLLFYEPWATRIPLDDFSSGDQLDLDRPRKNLDCKNPSIQDRAPYFLVKMIQSKDCKRANFAIYLNDQTAEGESQKIISLKLCCRVS